MCYHGKDWSRGHVFAESCVERHVLQVQVVLLHVVFRGLKTNQEKGVTQKPNESTTSLTRNDSSVFRRKGILCSFSQVHTGVQHCHGYLHEFGSDQLEAPLLEALDDLTTQSSLDAIGLHGNEGTLHVC